MNNASYGRLTAGLIAVWFVFAVSASALHAFKRDPDLPPLALGLAVLVPIVAFLFWFATSAGFRQFALSLSPRTLTFVQSWRIAGFTFLALYAAGVLPGVFALPAGWGDIAIGATAPWAARKLASASRRSSFITWQILGTIDLVMAVALGDDRPAAEPPRSYDRSNDGAASEPDSHIRCAAAHHASRHLHRPSHAVEGGTVVAGGGAITVVGVGSAADRLRAC